MRKSRYSDNQILAILRQNEQGASVPDLCREHGMSSAQFYKWRARFGDMDASMIKRSRESYKAIFAQGDGCEIGTQARRQYSPSLSAYSVSESRYRYQARHSGDNIEIADWLSRLTTTNKRWGFGLCFLYLRNVKGYGFNHKCLYRIYRELELSLRIKPRRRIKRDRPLALGTATAINQVWSMDFMSDALSDGRSLRTFNVIDDYNREALGVEVGLSLPGQRVILGLDRIIEWRGKPAAIRCDNGPEYLSQVMLDWAHQHRITLMYIQPGKPTLNAYIERFNRTAQHEWLDLHEFESVEQTQSLATEWLWLYNNERPHTAIGVCPRGIYFNRQRSKFYLLVSTRMGGLLSCVGIHKCSELCRPENWGWQLTRAPVH